MTEGEEEKGKWTGGGKFRLKVRGRLEGRKTEDETIKEEWTEEGNA